MLTVNRIDNLYLLCFLPWHFSNLNAIVRSGAHLKNIPISSALKILCDSYSTNKFGNNFLQSEQTSPLLLTLSPFTFRNPNSWRFFNYQAIFASQKSCILFCFGFYRKSSYWSVSDSTLFKPFKYRLLNVFMYSKPQSSALQTFIVSNNISIF